MDTKEIERPEQEQSTSIRGRIQSGRGKPNRFKPNRIQQGFQRLLCGLLAIPIVLANVPLAGAWQYLAPQGQNASAVYLEAEAPLCVSGDKAKKAYFQQGHEPRLLEQMTATLNDGKTIVHPYYADQSKGYSGAVGPGDGRHYIVSNSITDTGLVGILSLTNARLGSIQEFLQHPAIQGKGLDTSNFDDWAYFCASQVAVWVALEEAYLPALETPYTLANGTPIHYASSEGLGYTCSDTVKSNRPITPDPTVGDLAYTTLYAAYLMLEYGNTCRTEWDKIGHFPYVGTTFTYSPASETFDPAKKKADWITANGIVNSEYFKEVSYNNDTWLAMPLAVSSATFVRDYKANVSIKTRVNGIITPLDNDIFLRDGEDANNAASFALSLSHMTIDKDNPTKYWVNDNGASYGQSFYLYIRKSRAKQLDTNGDVLHIQLSVNEMQVASYNIHTAYAKNRAIQPLVIADQATQLLSSKWQMTLRGRPTVDLKVHKINKSGEPLEGAAYQFAYKDTLVVEEAVPAVIPAKIVEVATHSKDYDIDVGSSRCEAWVEQVYSKAGAIWFDGRPYPFGDIYCCARHNGDCNRVEDSSLWQMDEIPIGAMVYAGRGYWSSVTCHNGHNAGHVGIYIGDGKVAHSVSSGPKIEPLVNWVGRLSDGGWGYGGADPEQFVFATVEKPIEQNRTVYAEPLPGQPGVYVFHDIPVNRRGTLTETKAPEGYSVMSPIELTTNATNTTPTEVTLMSNSPTPSFVEIP